MVKLRGSAFLFYICSVFSSCNPAGKAGGEKIVAIPVLHAEDGVNAIKDPAFKKLVEETNYYLDAYAGLNPWETYTDTLGYAIPPKELHEMLAMSDERAKVPVESLKAYFEKRILENMKTVLSNKKVMDYHLKDLLHLEVRASDDHKMFSLFYEVNTSGSAKTKISFLHYRNDDGELFNYYPGADSIPVVDPNGFDSIYVVKSAEDVKYLLLGGNVGCNTCYNRYVQLIKFVNGGPVKYFEYSLSQRGTAGDENGIVYNAVKQTINVNFVKDDLSSSCPCLPANKNKTLKKCVCSYTYNGNTFVFSVKKLK